MLHVQLYYEDFLYQVIIILDISIYQFFTFFYFMFYFNFYLLVNPTVVSSIAISPEDCDFFDRPTNRFLGFSGLGSFIISDIFKKLKVERERKKRKKLFPLLFIMFTTPQFYFFLLRVDNRFKNNKREINKEERKNQAFI